MTVDLLMVPALAGQEGAAAIARHVRALPGVGRVDVNLGDRSVRVEHDERVTLAALVKAIGQAGYDQVYPLV